MSLCGICYGEIEDGEPMDEEHLSYDGCEGERESWWLGKICVPTTEGKLHICNTRPM